MTTKMMIALAIPAGIAKQFVTAKVYFILGMIVGFGQMIIGGKIVLCALVAALGTAFASAKAGEYTDGRAGEYHETPRIDRAFDAGMFYGRVGNDAFGRIANNQQFLNGVSFALEHSHDSSFDAAFAAARDAGRSYGSPLTQCDIVCGSTTWMNGFAGALGSGAGTGAAGGAGMAFGSPKSQY